MQKPAATQVSTGNRLFTLIGGWLSLLLLAYGRLLVHPNLRTACPENDTWNLPIRWSVLSSLREGHLPLWNPLSAFGIPWLATWQTESFYPGTLLFSWLGLSAWNFSGLVHLLLFSSGVFLFLRNNGVRSFGAFFGASIALLNGCAYNHLGSNSSMDTMAWIPWLFLAVKQSLEKRPCARFRFTLFFALQVFAGYPQIIFYTLIGCLAYALFLKGPRSTLGLVLPLAAGLLLSAAQWIPSVEYFFLDAVRLPAVHDDPHFYLPLENLKTFLNFDALARDGKPDYVASPTFFYFNFYSGIIPLLLIFFGLFRYRRLKSDSRFFLLGFFAFILWSLGSFLTPLGFIHIPFPGFLEPAKSWVLINVFELFSLGLLVEDLFPHPGKWKWIVLWVCLLNLLYPIWEHPLEANLIPPDEPLASTAREIKGQLGSGRVLVLPNPEEHQALYTPMPDPEHKPLFKHFIPNSNLFVSLPLATFYGSTQPSWGALDAGFYFQYLFPERNGTLMDLLGIDLIYLPQDNLPPPFIKIHTDGKWTLWKNPASVGSHFFFEGTPQSADRKSIFMAFAGGRVHPLQNLFIDMPPVSRAPQAVEPPLGSAAIPVASGQKDGFLVVTQNAMPGWRAWVDGKPAGICLADGLFQGVAIKAGDKEVRLSYEPASFRIGLFLSLVSLGVLGVYAALLRKLNFTAQARSSRGKTKDKMVRGF
jgi:hypothetical protein